MLRIAVLTPFLLAAAGPPPYTAPVGDFLQTWGKDLAVGTNDGPPLLFMLDSSELRSGRHAWKVPKIADLMARDLAAVLDEGCAQKCDAEAEHARTAAHALVDAEQPVDSPPTAKRWKTGDADMTMFHRSFAMHRVAGKIAFDVTCRCDSETVGMRMWNDLGTCDAVLSERGRMIARYQPRVLLARTKMSTFVELDAYDQTVELASHETLVIASGYTYAGGVDFAHMTDTPLTKATPRGSLTWAR